MRIQLTFEDSLLRVRIEDNGRGFDASARPKSGNGLRNLRKRFHDLGGQFDLQSQPGQGTRVSLAIRLETVPVPAPH